MLGLMIFPLSKTISHWRTKMGLGASRKQGTEAYDRESIEAAQGKMVNSV